MAAKVGRHNQRQRLFAQGIAAGKTQKQAALDAGYSENVARDPKRKLLSGIALREYFAKLLPSEEEIAQRLREGLSAERTEYVQWRNGKSVKTKAINLVDFSERRQYARLCANYRGLPELQQVAVTGAEGEPIKWLIQTISPTVSVKPNLEIDVTPAGTADE